MIREVWKDPAGRTLLKLGGIVSGGYLLLVAVVWAQDHALLPGHFSHGGAGGLQALVTALTALVVVYYLVETRRLRFLSQQQLEVAQQQDWPLIAFTLELERTEPQQRGPVLYARNLGSGAAVNVHIIGLSTSLPMIVAPRSLISALSSGGRTAVLQWLEGANQDTIRQDVGRMSLKVTCFEQTRVTQLRWLWRGLPDWPGEFTLESFSKVGQDTA